MRWSEIVTAVRPPLVTVLMPVFNAERYLDAAIRGILAQTFADFEFVIVNDGSTDSSPAILRKWEASDRRIRLVSRPNTGIVQALNDGLALARGMYLARMDADDLALPNRLERQVEYLTNHPDCVLVGCAITAIDPSGRELMECGPDSPGPLGMPACPVSRLLNAGAFLLHPAIMAVTTEVRAIGGYRKEYEWIEDSDLYLRLARRGRLHCLPEVLLKYRLHLASVSRTRTRQQAHLRIRLARELLAERGLPDAEVTAVEERIARDQLHEPTRAESETETLRTWSWLALQSGWRVTAVRLALAALRRRPLHGPCWWTLLNAVIGTTATHRLLMAVQRWKGRMQSSAPATAPLRS